jgi:hypothetical protein
MSYDAEILADSPIGYWKIEELSTSGSLTDSSGNGYHGNFFTSTPLPVLGIAGPIETDASSHGGRSRIATVAAGAGHDLDVVDAFTWEVWGFLDDTVQNYVQLCRQGSFALNGSNLIGFDSGHAAARISVGSGGANTFNLSSTSVLTSGNWFHMVVTRNGSTMLLYVNGPLADQRTDLPSGSIVYANYNEADWTIGASLPSGTANHAQGTSRVAIYGAALSPARILAHYEAAKASLPLRATIVINLGLELNTDQIDPTDFGFAHNYSDPFGDSQIPIVETLEYKTNVNKSEPDYEQRVSAQPHGALRSLEYHLTPSGYAARARLQGSLYSPAQFYTLPVWSDSGVLTAEATSGNNTIELDTTKRDYEVGSYVGFCSDLQDPTTYQFYKITAVADDELTLESDISTTVASGSPVFPARIVSISEDTLAVKSYAADHEASVIRFDVIESELSTRRITAYTPGTTYKSIEVFTLETAKVHFRDDRPFDIARRIQAHGRDYQYASDTGSPQTFPVRFLLATRAALSEFYGWLDARQGKLNPVFVSTKEHDYVALARPTSTTLTVKKAGFSFHHGRRDLEILKTDGSFSRVRLTAISDNGNGTETLTSPDTFPSFATISRVSFLKRCTLAQDTIQIRYFKGGANGAVIAESGVSFRELLTSPV